MNTSSALMFLKIYMNLQDSVYPSEIDQLVYGKKPSVSIGSRLGVYHRA